MGSERGGILTEHCARIQTRCCCSTKSKKPTVPDESVPASFDEGWLTDGRGRRVYLSDAIVIMTSNLGSDSFKKFEKPLGFGTKTSNDFRQVKKDVMKAAEARFSPEFRNRIDEIVVFSPLTMDEVKQIAQLLR